MEVGDFRSASGQMATRQSTPVFSHECKMTQEITSVSVVRNGFTPKQGAEKVLITGSLNLPYRPLLDRGLRLNGKISSCYTLVLYPWTVGGLISTSVEVSLGEVVESVEYTSFPNR